MSQYRLRDEAVSKINEIKDCFIPIESELAMTILLTELYIPMTEALLVLEFST